MPKRTSATKREARKKNFIGVRLRRLREDRQMTQQALARAIGLSASYLNQLENNQRPVTTALLLRFDALFGNDIQLLSEDDEARLIADLGDAVADPFLGEHISRAEVQELAATMPAVARAFIHLHGRYRQMAEQAATLAARISDDRTGEARATPEAILPFAPFEEVREFMYERHNYIEEIDIAAENLSAVTNLPPGNAASELIALIAQRHGVRVEISTQAEGADREVQRSYDPQSHILQLSSRLRAGQQAFQIATQLALLEQDDLISTLVNQGRFMSTEARRLARIGLANYFAGALILPYRTFLQAAEALRYDIDLLSHRFGVGYETICHRLSTLQRQDARGVPFFFIRVDRAGNISKRQSATDFHFSRIGGTCPLWNVYDAFAHPGKVLTQIARMPDGRAYLWIARTVSRDHGGYRAPSKTFAVALGCDLRHAERLVYSDGLDLSNPAAATPIGVGCKVCDRPSCPQRAFPPIGKTLEVDETRRVFSPYSDKLKFQTRE
ncbi:short-chain fatty acyl-CoA regulator family protein [Pseudochelatococcus sp. G4_1912]|uniref:short-chain fatty acyl-CoA regulator family protein n=1 Tax=Pseudochelatococcus sp. G4_1912 TaxID=3114288 RepID=UPI0039C6FAD4